MGRRESETGQQTSCGEAAQKQPCQARATDSGEGCIRSDERRAVSVVRCAAANESSPLRSDLGAAPTPRPIAIRASLRSVRIDQDTWHCTLIMLGGGTLPSSQRAPVLCLPSCRDCTVR